MLSSTKPETSTTILPLPGGDYHYFADAGGIFEEAFINSIVDKIKEYNTTRQLEQKSAAFGENDFRALPDLSKYLYAASSAEHCAFILVYLWNMTADHHTVEFQAMVDRLRFNISMAITNSQKARTTFSALLLGFQNVCTNKNLPSCYLDAIMICDLVERKTEETKPQRQHVEILSVLSTFLKEPPITRRHTDTRDTQENIFSPYISYMIERFAKLGSQEKKPATTVPLEENRTNFWSRLSSSGKPALEPQTTLESAKLTASVEITYV